MKEVWICFYRKRCGKCLWSAIGEINQKLYENKQNEMDLKHRMSEFENSFFEKVISMDETLFQLEDGWMRKSASQKLSPADDPSKCIYLKYGCEAIWRLKKRVLAYHFSQYMALLEQYNQLKMLAGCVNHYHRSLLTQPENIVLVYEKEPYLVMGYCPIIPEKDFKDHPLTLSIFFIKDKLKVLNVPILLKYHLSHEVLKDTYWTAETHDILVELIWNRDIEKQLLKPITQCMQEWIKKWNALYKNHPIKIEGWYIEVGDLEQAQRVICEGLLTDQSYQILGRVKSGVFKEKQLMIWNKHTYHAQKW